jgi:hypothetical protein
MKTLKPGFFAVDTSIVCMYDRADCEEGMRMQKNPAKGLFIDSSCRRTGLLKTLLQGHRHKQGRDTSGDGPTAHEGCAFPPPEAVGCRDESDKSSMRKVVSL